MWPFRKKLVTVQVRIVPLNGIGTNKKAAFKFLKKFFGSCGNYEATRLTLEAMETGRTGCFDIYGEIPSRLANKLYRSREKYGVHVEINGTRGLRGNNDTIRQHFSSRRKSWVIAG